MGYDLYEKKGFRLKVLNFDLIGQYNTWVSSVNLRFSSFLSNVVFASFWLVCQVISWILIYGIVIICNLPYLFVFLLIYVCKWNCYPFMLNWWYRFVTKTDEHKSTVIISVADFHRNIIAELVFETLPMLVIQIINAVLLKNKIYISKIGILALAVSFLFSVQHSYHYGRAIIWERKSFKDIDLAFFEKINDSVDEKIKLETLSGAKLNHSDGEKGVASSEMFFKN